MSKNPKIENVYLFLFQQFSSTPGGLDSVTSICCYREIPKADSVFDPRQKGLFNQKWLQKKVSHIIGHDFKKTTKNLTETLGRI